MHTAPAAYDDWEVIREHHDLRASISLVRVGQVTDPDKRVYAVYRISDPRDEPNLGSFGCTCGWGSANWPCQHMRYADDPANAAHLRYGKRGTAA